MNTHNHQPAKPRRKRPNISVVPPSAAQAKHLNVEGEPVTRTHSTAGGAEWADFDPWGLTDIAGAVMDGGIEIAGTIAGKAIESAGDVIS